MLDIDKIRSETPSCTTTLHFNNAGAALMPAPVYKAVTDHLALENRIGGYEAEDAAQPEIQAFYTEFAALLNADPTEIAYIENATRAWDMAFYGLPLQPGARILTHASEYPSNYMALLQQAKRRGLHVDLVPSDPTGQIDVAALETMITPQTRLIALTHVPTHGGLVNPAAEVGKVARKHGLWYLLDACQSVGQIDLDVKTLGCHILSGTGRKFLRGPRGTGFLYVSKDLLGDLEPPFIDLHAATLTGVDSYTFAKTGRKFENWESFVAGRVGLTAAVRYARGLGLPAIETRVEALASRLRAALKGISDVQLHDRGARKCGITTFHKASEPADLLAARLRRDGINVSTTTAGGARLDGVPDGPNQLIRASVHYYNTDAEIARFCEAVSRN